MFDRLVIVNITEQVMSNYKYTIKHYFIYIKSYSKPILFYPLIVNFSHNFAFKVNIC